LNSSEGNFFNPRSTLEGVFTSGDIFPHCKRFADLGVNIRTLFLTFLKVKLTGSFASSSSLMISSCFMSTSLVSPIAKSSVPRGIFCFKCLFECCPTLAPKPLWSGVRTNPRGLIVNITRNVSLSSLEAQILGPDDSAFSFPSNMRGRLLLPIE